MDTDPDDLKEDLVMDIIRLQKDLNILGYDMVYIKDFLKETRALEVGAQIQKLRKQIDRMTKMKKSVFQCAIWPEP